MAKKVYQNVPREEAIRLQGKVPITVKWVDINKGDDDRPNYRSRMVGKEFNDKVLDGLFAAPPPLEAPRMLISWAATVDVSPPGVVDLEPEDKCILIADVSRAFFEAPAKRDICVELPEEALTGGETTQDTVGKLLASLYGTRDASAN